MKVKLKNEWMGHKKGSVLNLTNVSAKRLIDLGTAEIFEEEGDKVKGISSPPKDKMVRRPVRKK